MNRCDVYLEKLSAYLDGEMSANEMKTFEEHLKECKTCTKELQTLKTMISACGELEEELPDSFEASLHKRLEEAREKTVQKSDKTRRIKILSQIAAGFILVLCLGFMIRAGLFKTKVGFVRIESAAPMMMEQDAGSEESMENVAGITAYKEMEPQTAEDSIVVSRGASKAEIEMEGPATDIRACGGEADGKNEEIPDDGLMLAFSEDVDFAYGKVDGQDTVIKISAENTTDVLNSIMEIDTNISGEKFSNLKTLNNTLETVRSGEKDQVEVNLFYFDDKTWEAFLNEMQSAFPDMQVQSVPAKENQEYIRVIIQKK